MFTCSHVRFGAALKLKCGHIDVLNDVLKKVSTVPRKCECNDVMFSDFCFSLREVEMTQDAFEVVGLLVRMKLYNMQSEVC